MIEQAIIQDMKTIKIILFGVIIAASCWSCTPKATASKQTVAKSKKITGTLEKLEVTTFQYGSHEIGGFAVRSNTVELDNYIGRKVRVTGRKIEGYPVDGGPKFFEIVKVEEIGKDMAIDKLVGKVEKLEETVWQYGSHMISGYAIKSDLIDLDAYLGKKVSLKVAEIEGYPCDFGPRFFEVTGVEIL